MRGSWLFGEELADVGKGLELERDCRQGREKTWCLFADLAIEPNRRLDDEGGASATNPVGHSPPCFPREHNVEVGTGTSWPSTGLW